MSESDYVDVPKTGRTIYDLVSMVRVKHLLLLITFATFAMVVLTAFSVFSFRQRISLGILGEWGPIIEQSSVTKSSEVKDLDDTSLPDELVASDTATTLVSWDDAVSSEEQLSAWEAQIKKLSKTGRRSTILRRLAATNAAPFSHIEHFVRLDFSVDSGAYRTNATGCPDDYFFNTVAVLQYRDVNLDESFRNGEPDSKLIGFSIDVPQPINCGENKVGTGVKTISVSRQYISNMFRLDLSNLSYIDVNVRFAIMSPPGKLKS